MNKKLLAAAVAGALAIPGMAFAQSSVTLYGKIDTGVRNQSKVDDGAGGTGSVTTVTDGLHTTNRWGMTGSEDLGGGLKANFTLEGQYASDTGAANSSGLFARKSIVGLSSSSGFYFDMGRDYTVNFKANGVMDPMGYEYTGLSLTAGPKFTAGTRSSNMVTGGYSANGITIRADYAMGEVVGNGSGGRRVGVEGEFHSGPMALAGAYSTENNADNTGSTKYTNIGGSYMMNGFTFLAGWNQVSYDQVVNANTDKSRLFMLGVRYNFSSRVQGRLGYYDVKDTARAGLPGEGKRKTTILGVDYSLSKRTTAYFEVDHHSLDGIEDGTKIDQPVVFDGTTGVGVGIAHSF